MSETQNQVNCPLTNYSVEHYSAIKNDVIFLFWTKWELEAVVLSGTSKKVKEQMVH